MESAAWQPALHNTRRASKSRTFVTSTSEGSYAVPSQGSRTEMMSMEQKDDLVQETSNYAEELKQKFESLNDKDKAEVLEIRQQMVDCAENVADSYRASGASGMHLTTRRSRTLRMQDEGVPQGSGMTAGGFGTQGEPPVEIRGFSLGNFAIGAGALVTFSSFAEYLKGGSEQVGLSGLGFVYGLPICLIGAALKYAEIEPVPIQATDAAKELFESKKTKTIEKINADVTRHRYGDEAHLDSAVKLLGLVLPGRAYPQLQLLKYGITPDNELEFTMVWKSEETPFTVWNEADRIERYDSFFGPGVWAQVEKVSGPDRLVGIKLTTGERPTSKEEEEKEEPVAA
jgi:hypothetical protein